MEHMPNQTNVVVNADVILKDIDVLSNKGNIGPNCKRYVIYFSTRSSIPHRNVNVRAAWNQYP
jgi:hypothetical protein